MSKGSFKKLTEAVHGLARTISMMHLLPEYNALSQDRTDAQKVKDSEVRRLIADRIMRFYNFNNAGLESNCASFAYFILTGKVITKLRDCPKWFIAPEPLYYYKGQKIEIGDYVCVLLAKESIYQNVDGMPLLEIAHTTSPPRQIYRNLEDFAKRHNKMSTQGQTLASVQKLVSKEYIGDIHCMVCVGHAQNDEGIPQPIFVSQNGSNAQKMDELVVTAFGKIVLTLFNYVDTVFNLPFIVLCSRPINK